MLAYSSMSHRMHAEVFFFAVVYVLPTARWCTYRNADSHAQTFGAVLFQSISLEAAVMSRYGRGWRRGYFGQGGRRGPPECQVFVKNISYKV